MLSQVCVCDTSILGFQNQNSCSAKRVIVLQSYASIFLDLYILRTNNISTTCCYLNFYPSLLMSLEGVTKDIKDERQPMGKRDTVV